MGALSKKQPETEEKYYVPVKAHALVSLYFK